MDTKKVGNAIAYLRKRAGFTQRDLADRIGISDKAVSKWERGLGLPDITYLSRLSILLDTDTDSLLAGDVIHHDNDWRGLMILPEGSECISVGTTVFDKPMAYYLLSYFILLGIRGVFISCGYADERFLRSEFGDGSALGVSLIYCRHLKADVEQAIAESGGFRNLMITYGRMFLYGVDQTRFFYKAMSHRGRATVLSLPKKSSGVMNESSVISHQNRGILAFNDKREVVQSNSGERVFTQYDYCPIPVLFCPREYLPLLTSKTDTMQIELTNFEENNLLTEVLDRGYVEMAMEDEEQVLDVSNFVRLVQNACGMKIYCIEEIAWRRGLISLEKMKVLGQAKASSQYGEYILSLCERYSSTRRT